MLESLSGRMSAPAIEANQITSVHHSYSKLNTTHGSPGHLEPEHPQLGCIHFLFTMSNQQTRAKALVITNRSWYLYVLLLIFIVSPQSPAGISIPSGFRTIRFGSQSRPGSLINIATRLPTSKRSLVEADGIEPTTSCLQSTRSPN